jgi:hypothetical protein
VVDGGPLRARRGWTVAEGGSEAGGRAGGLYEVGTGLRLVCSGV